MQPARASILTCALSLLASIATAQDVRLLKQVYPRSGPNPSSDPSLFVAVGNHVYSSSKRGVIRYDRSGTNGRYLYGDLAKEIVGAGRTLFFTRRDHILYSSDGTRHGTRSLLSLSLRGATELTPLGNNIVFAADGTSGREPWISDGTLKGTTELKNINRGTASSKPAQLTRHGARVYFVADDGVHGAELWRTDGTTAGTVRVTDLRTGGGDADIRHLRSDGSRLWFFANRTGTQFELWTSDGTTTNTVPVIPATPHTTLLPYRGGVVVLQNRNGRLELWGSNGTRAGSLLLKDLGAAATNTTNIQPIVAGGYAYFATPDLFGNGRLWRTDGTAAGTIALTGLGHIPRGASLAALGTRVFYPGGRNMPRGVELWTTDGTVAGTREFKDIHAVSSSNPKHLRAIGNRLWMAADDGVHGTEPWSSDGTPAGTKLVANLLNWEQPYAGFYDEVVDGDRAWFLQEDFGTAWLWTTDGTAAGTRSVQIQRYRPGRFLMAGLGKVFFSAPQSRASQTAHDLWESDGTNAGTKLLKAKVGYCHDMVDLGRVAVFGGGIYGHELWVTDGTAAGTKKLTSSVYPLRVRGSRFLRDGTRAWYIGNSGQLHVTDGTIAGTRRVAATASYQMMSQPIRFGRFVAFVASGGRLVRTDGTVAGTTAIAVKPTISFSGPLLLANSRGVFLINVDRSYSTEILFSDFTAGGTRQLGYLRNGVLDSGTVFRDRFYFTWTTPASGIEPWVSDGTPAGTAMLKDIEPGAGSSRAVFGTSTGDRFLYFTAEHDLQRSIWRTDGTRTGTVRLNRSPDGPGHPMIHVGGRLVLTAIDKRLGFQPHVVDLFANNKVIGHGCAGTARVPTLTSNDPVLGGRLRLNLGSPHANQAAVVLLGLPTSGPRHLRLPGGCTIYPDVTQLVLPTTLRTNGAGSGQLSLPIPNLPALVRARLYAQSAVGRTTTGPLGTDLTPAVSLTLGR